MSGLNFTNLAVHLDHLQGATTASTADIHAAEVSQALDALLIEADGQDVTATTGLEGELNALASYAEKLASESPPAGAQSDNRRKLLQQSGRMRGKARLAAELPPSKRALLHNAEQWAIHYSNIRLGVTTFLVGISWAMVALKWDKFDLSLAVAAAVVWLMVLVVFFVFTAETHGKSGAEEKNRLFFLPTKPSDRRRRHIPTVIVAVAFLLFLVLEWAWSIPQPDTARPAIDERNTGEKTTRSVVFSAHSPPAAARPHSGEPLSIEDFRAEVLELIQAVHSSPAVPPDFAQDLEMLVRELKLVATNLTVSSPVGPDRAPRNLVPPVDNARKKPLP